MTKAEREMVTGLRRGLALAWPQFDRPVPVNLGADPEIQQRKTVALWTFNAHAGEVRHGCTNGHLHSSWSTAKADTQNAGGPWFRTRLEALKALRYALSEKCAVTLARVDEHIEEERGRCISEDNGKQ